MCVTPYVPFAGIDHAGGAYLHAYLTTAVRAGWDVHVVAPSNGANIAALSLIDDSIHVVLHPSRSGLLSRLRNVIVDGIPAVSGARWWRNLPTEVVAVLRAADVVDLHFSDSLWNAPVLKRELSGVRLIGLAHDVRTESLERARGTAKGRAWLEGWLGLAATRRQERASLSACATVHVFKREDVTTLRDLGVTSEIELVPIVTPDTTRIPPPDPSSRRVLFAAAFHRAENVEAAEWLLDQVMPELRRLVPDVRLRLAGARPPARLAERVSKVSSQVELTGYMTELSDAYREVACVAIPLRRGAGVKFKTVEAVRAGFPVVSTQVGAEGVKAITGSDLAGVADDPLTFARLVADVLSHEGGAEPVGTGLTDQRRPDESLDEFFANLGRTLD